MFTVVVISTVSSRVAGHRGNNIDKQESINLFCAVLRHIDVIPNRSMALYRQITSESKLKYIVKLSRYHANSLCYPTYSSRFSWPNRASISLSDVIGGMLSYASSRTNIRATVIMMTVSLQFYRFCNACSDIIISRSQPSHAVCLKLLLPLNVIPSLYLT